MSHEQPSGFAQILNDKGVYSLRVKGAAGSDEILGKLVELHVPNKEKNFYERFEQSREDIWNLCINGGLISKTGIIFNCDLNSETIPEKFKEKLDNYKMLKMNVNSIKENLGRDLNSEWGLGQNGRMYLFAPQAAKSLGYRITVGGSCSVYLKGKENYWHEMHFVDPFANHVRLVMSDLNLPKNVRIPYTQIASQTLFEIAKWWGQGDVTHETINFFPKQ